MFWWSVHSHDYFQRVCFVCSLTWSQIFFLTEKFRDPSSVFLPFAIAKTKIYLRFHNIQKRATQVALFCMLCSNHILCANFFRELIARSACVVALDQCVRSDCVVTLTIRSAPRGLGAPPSPPSPLPCFFFFSGGGGFFLYFCGGKGSGGGLVYH